MESKMKYMITTALALCLLGGAAAAQDRDHDRERGPESRQGAEHRGGPPAVAPQAGQRDGLRLAPQPAPQAAPQAARPQGGAPRVEDRRGPGPNVGGDRRDFRGAEQGRDRRDFGDRRDNRGRPERFRGPEPGFRPGFWARDHGWRGGGHFRAPSYRYPRGYSYQRWTFGAFLPFAFLAPDYLIGSYWTYGLPAPPPGYHWVRVGPDALLVRYGDGYVLDVVYDLFY